MVPFFIIIISPKDGNKKKKIVTQTYTVLVIDSDRIVKTQIFCC